MCVSVVDHGRRSSPAADCLRGLHRDCSVFQAGRGHGEFRNPLIIRYYLNESVETQPFLGHVSTLYFVNHWKSVSPENKRGRVSPVKNTFGIWSAWITARCYASLCILVMYFFLSSSSRLENFSTPKNRYALYDELKFRHQFSFKPATSSSVSPVASQMV